MCAKQVNENSVMYNAMQCFSDFACLKFLALRYIIKGHSLPSYFGNALFSIL